MEAENFWPANLLDDLPTRTALTILQDQAKGLPTRTDHLLEGVVKTSADGDQLEHQFLIHAPVLGIRVPLLKVSSGPSGLPLTAVGKYVRPSPRTFQALDELNALLKEVFNSKEVVQAIRQLVAESRAKGLPFFLVEDDECIGSATTREDAAARAIRRARPDDLIDIYELQTGKRIGHVDWIGKDKAEVTWTDAEAAVPNAP